MIRSKLASDEVDKQKSTASPSPSPAHSSVQALPVSLSPSPSPSPSPSASSPSPSPKSFPPEEYLETNKEIKKTVSDVQSISSTVERDINSGGIIPNTDYSIATNIDLTKEVDQIPQTTTTDGIYVFKDDIQFEKITDIDEIMITRIDKQQLVEYTPDQSVQEINKLLKMDNNTNRESDLPTQRSIQNMAHLLQRDRYISTSITLITNR
eukprot:7481445-Pyramimonas_sp.AAC.1